LIYVKFLFYLFPITTSMADRCLFVFTDVIFQRLLKSPIGDFNHFRYFHQSVIVTGPWSFSKSTRPQITSFCSLAYKTTKLVSFAPIKCKKTCWFIYVI